MLKIAQHTHTTQIPFTPDLHNEIKKTKVASNVKRETFDSYQDRGEVCDKTYRVLSIQILVI